MRYLLLFSILLVLPLSGCGKSDPPPKLFESQRNELNKAKALEGQLQQQADQEQKKIDQQTQ